MTPEALLARIRGALGPAHGAPPPLPAVPHDLCPAVDRADLVQSFVAAARKSGAEVFAAPDAPAFAPAPHTLAPFETPHAVVHAAAGIAVSGSVVITEGATLTMMAAPVLVVHLDPRTIVATLHDALSAFTPDAAGRVPATRVIVTGPSKTADIEGILITGVHGPGRVVIVLGP